MGLVNVLEQPHICMLMEEIIFGTNPVQFGSFMDVPPCLGANNIRKCLCEFFSAQYGPQIEIAEIRPEFHKFR